MLSQRMKEDGDRSEEGRGGGGEEKRGLLWSENQEGITKLYVLLKRKIEPQSSQNGKLGIVEEKF